MDLMRHVVSDRGFLTNSSALILRCALTDIDQKIKLLIITFSFFVTISRFLGFTRLNSRVAKPMFTYAWFCFMEELRTGIFSFTTAHGIR